MKQLVDILYGVNYNLHGCSSRDYKEKIVSGIGFNSRTITKDELFVALRGTQQTGIAFSKEVLEKGAVAIVGHNEDIQMILHLQSEYTDRCFIAVEDPAQALAVMAANFYDHPAEKLCLIGVTGTNGKTTIATLLHKLLVALGEPCGLLSTIHYQIDQEYIPATHTTPDAVTLQQLMSQMLRKGCRYASMEVSSHALAQHRTYGLSFNGAILSNITHDHLDYHKDFLSYVRTKKRFFDLLSREAFALINTDDANGKHMLQNCHAIQQQSYALATQADYKGKIFADTPEGLEMEIEGIRTHFKLAGYFNAYNLLAVAGAGHLLGVDMQECLQALSNLYGAEGRFEWIPNNKGLHVVIDYAHTPDALQQVLFSLHRMLGAHRSAKIFSVVGCGGDRDPFKRAKMGKIASRYSALSLFTSDNPRNEPPEAIIEDMKKTLPTQAKKKVLSIVDREEAITEALKKASPGDFVLIAGKGHETYQERKGLRKPFSDKYIVNNYLNNL